MTLLSLVRKDEFSRGLWASVAVTLAMVYVETLLEKQAGVSTDAVFLYNDLTVGGLLGFVADKYFASDEGFKLLRGSRSVWHAGNFKRSVVDALAGTEIVRFFVTVFLDALVSVPLYAKTLQVLPEAQRDSVLIRRGMKLAVSVATFMLFNNALRFDWAYKANPTANMEMLVVVFALCGSLAYLALDPVRTPGEPGYATMNPRSKTSFVSAGLALLTLYKLVVTLPPSVRTAFTRRVPTSARSSLLVAALLAFSVKGLLDGRTRAAGRRKKLEPQNKPSAVDHAVGLGLLGVSVVNVVWFVRG